MQPMLLFDLDDTLILTHRRHYKVVADFFALNNQDFISMEDYIKVRRDKNLSNSSLVKELNSSLLLSFKDYWYNNIESSAYLKFDTSIVQADLLLQLQAQGYMLGIVSLRSNKKMATEQLKNFSWFSSFTEVYFAEHSSSNNPKVEIIQNLSKQYNVIALTGDAEADKEAALSNKIEFYGVNTGLYKTGSTDANSDVNDIIKSILHVHP